MASAPTVLNTSWSLFMTGIKDSIVQLWIWLFWTRLLLEICVVVVVVLYDLTLIFKIGLKRKNSSLQKMSLTSTRAKRTKECDRSMDSWPLKIWSSTFLRLCEPRLNSDPENGESLAVLLHDWTCCAIRVNRYPKFGSSSCHG